MTKGGAPAIRGALLRSAEAARERGPPLGEPFRRSAFGVEGVAPATPWPRGAWPSTETVSALRVPAAVADGAQLCAGEEPFEHAGRAGRERADGDGGDASFLERQGRQAGGARQQMGGELAEIGLMADQQDLAAVAVRA